MAEVSKHHLKYKSYEIIHKLYENASKYYQEDLQFEGTLLLTHMAQVVKAALPDYKEEEIEVVIKNLFGDKQDLTFEELQ